jgi:hypothetical protein
MDVGILGDLGRYKLPALAQVQGIKIGRPVIVLVSRSGFTPGLVEAALRQERVTLLDLETMARLPAANVGDSPGGGNSNARDTFPLLVPPPEP